MALVSLLLPVPLGEVVAALDGGGLESYSDCECDSVQIESKTANASKMTSTLFDVEQVSQPVIRMLVSVPEDTTHKYLVIEISYLTEENRSIKSYRTTTRVKYDKVKIIEIEHSEKMKMAPRLKIEAVGWTNNSLDTYPDNSTE